MSETTEVTRPEFETAVERLRDEDHRASKRLDTLEETVKEINALTVNVERLAANIETMTKELSNQGEKLSEIEARDGEKWRSMLSYIVTAIVGVVIGVVVTAIGL